LTAAPRGGSQVMTVDDGYFALIHTVNLFKSDVGRKDAIYRHQFLKWDNDFNLVNVSKDFSIMNGHVEFSVGMCDYSESDMLITFGWQDNASYILRISKQAIQNFLVGNYEPERYL
jgi:hypothetical protein